MWAVRSTHGLLLKASFRRRDSQPRLPRTCAETKVNVFDFLSFGPHRNGPLFTMNPNWPVEFSRIVACEACDPSKPKILRDAKDNPPQPGYIGESYRNTRLLLIGQNPGTRKAARADEDIRYSAALIAIRNKPELREYEDLNKILANFISRWPVQNNYFPLKECKLKLSNIAFFNLVRCRTDNDCSPSSQMVRNCRKNHFENWIELLRPKVVIFIGKWAWERGSQYLDSRGIPHGYMNRRRSLSSEARGKNRREVIKLVTTHCLGNRTAH